MSNYNNVPEDFLKEEIRCDFCVTEKMKKVWAVELEMLGELERVCQKYHLKYYADSGTLLGAVRHQGFIPWDDDVDLVMKRKDYNKLLEVAGTEFKYPFFLQSVYSDKKYIRGHAQLRNSETTGCILNDLQREFNRGIFLDIFPLDNVPDNKILLKIHKKRIFVMMKLMLLGVYYDRQEKQSLRRKVIGFVMHLFFMFVDYQKIFRHYEKVCARYNHKETKNVSYIAFSHGKEKHIWEKSWFEKCHRVPFEYTDIVIPDGYDARLKKEYGDYMMPRQVSTTHGEIILEPEVPYKKYFREEDKSV